VIVHVYRQLDYQFRTLLSRTPIPKIAPQYAAVKLVD
jgi:hypothetical protein